jgi:hypothetical protein
MATIRITIHHNASRSDWEIDSDTRNTKLTALVGDEINLGTLLQRQLLFSHIEGVADSIIKLGLKSIDIEVESG